MYVLIVTGLSGAGKTLALKQLEDHDFFCVDNLPLNLVDELVTRLKTLETVEKIALGIDSRNLSLHSLTETLDQVRNKAVKVEILFLDARDDVLVRRYGETRRNHPMARTGFVSDGIARERETLEQIRSFSTYFIDTSDMKPAQLTYEISVLIHGFESRFYVLVRSFGFKHAPCSDADIVMDVRFLPNPYWIGSLRALTGKDKPVIDYVFSFPHAKTFLQSFTSMITDLLPHYAQEGKTRLSIAFGCTGGQHRSVCMAEEISRMLTKQKIQVICTHRDLTLAVKPDTLVNGR